MSNIAPIDDLASQARLLMRLIQRYSNEKDMLLSQVLHLKQLAKEPAVMECLTDDERILANKTVVALDARYLGHNGSSTIPPPSTSDAPSLSDVAH